MSFPVPIKYLLNDNQDATVVVYDDGKEIEGLPTEMIPCGLIVRSLKFTPEHDIKAPDAFTVKLAPLRDCIINFYATSQLEPSRDTIIVSVLRAYYKTRSSYGSCGLSSSGTAVALTSVDVGNYDRDTGEFSIPGEGTAVLKAGVTYQLLQFALAEDS